MSQYVGNFKFVAYNIMALPRRQWGVEAHGQPWINPSPSPPFSSPLPPLSLPPPPLYISSTSKCLHNNLKVWWHHIKNSAFKFIPANIANLSPTCRNIFYNEDMKETAYNQLSRICARLWCNMMYGMGDMSCSWLITIWNFVFDKSQFIPIVWCEL